MTLITSVVVRCWSTRARNLVAAALIAVASASTASATVAPNCMQDAAGIALSCGANDAGLTDFHVTTVHDGCTTVGGTWSFDGEFNIDAGSPKRYDLGFYIAADGGVALNGQCNVGIIPQAQSDLDGDACGDYNRDAMTVAMSNVTAVCQDSDHDGKFDLAVCVSYDVNSGGICTGPQDAFPSSGPKCLCATIPTDEVVPRCTSNAECADDGNVCTTEVCNTLESGLGDLFGCSHLANRDSCDDGNFCNGTDTCGDAVCLHSGDPCSEGGACGNVCNEDLHTCFLSAGTVCRASTGVCDAAETCSGSSGDCPPDMGSSSGTICRPSTGSCDDAEVCDGSSPSCPADSVSPTGTVCHASTGPCDTEETCDGSSGACPAGGVASNETLCRASVGSCDAPEYCDGSSAACPRDAVSNSETVCRPSAGSCDSAETCDGSTGACPADSVSTSGTVCRASTGPCDAAETCDGSSGTCPSNAPPAVETLCRPSNGICDAPEYCNGSSYACPPDLGAEAGAVCRPSTGACDAAETCDGSSSTCPADTVAEAGTVCRPAADACDVAESCDGSSGACPADAFASSITPCNDDENVCTTDVCNGSGTCSHVPNTASCDDGNFCDGTETCSGGSCVSSGDPCAEGSECNDVCDEQSQNCFGSNGDPCQAACAVAGTGVCTDGVCAGEEIAMAPTCRWIVLAGVGTTSSGLTSKQAGVRSAGGSSMDGSTCGFYSRRTLGFVAGDFVVTSGNGQGRKGLGVRFGPGADVFGDIVTGGSTIKSGTVAFIPGTTLRSIATGTITPKVDASSLPTGFNVDTTGAHSLVNVCLDDQDKIADAVALVEGLTQNGGDLGAYKVLRNDATAHLDAVGPGPTIIDAGKFRLSPGSTLTLNGSATDVMIIRSSTDLRIGYNAKVVLAGGLIPENVLLYGKGRRCKVGRNGVGAGTVLCPNARRFVFGYASQWSGTAMGSAREIKILRNAVLTHKPFQGL